MFPIHIYVRKFGRQQTKETKKKISDSLKKYYPPFVKKCPCCEKEMYYKSRGNLRRSIIKNQRCIDCKVKKEIKKHHYSNMGRKSVKSQSIIRRSKNEIYFSELCNKRFRFVKTNEPMFNGWDADVIIEDIKVAILWNGIWHYKKIKSNHSTDQVRNRDKIKIKEIKKCGYTPYVIKDLGRHSKKLVESEFKKFLLTYDVCVV